MYNEISWFFVDTNSKHLFWVWNVLIFCQLCSKKTNRFHIKWYGKNLHVCITYIMFIFICVCVPVFILTKYKTAADFKMRDTFPPAPFFPFTFAVAWEGELPCRKWDCECAFKRQRGCCCAASELHEVEDQIFTRMMGLLTRMSQLGEGILEVIGTLERRHCRSLLLIQIFVLFWVKLA